MAIWVDPNKRQELNPATASREPGEYAPGLKGLKAYAKDISNHLGYGEDIHWEKDPYAFELNGEKHQAAGVYRRDTRKITLNPNLITTPYDLEMVLPHEVHHAMYHTFLDEATKDMKRGSKKAYNIFSKFIPAHIDTMEKHGNITPYSASWWKEHKGNKEHILRAVDETLAEMASLKTQLIKHHRTAQIKSLMRMGEWPARNAEEWDRRRHNMNQDAEDWAREAMVTKMGVHPVWSDFYHQVGDWHRAHRREQAENMKKAFKL